MVVQLAGRLQSEFQDSQQQQQQKKCVPPCLAWSYDFMFIPLKETEVPLMICESHGLVIQPG